MSFWKDNVYEFDGEKVKLTPRQIIKDHDVETHSLEIYGIRLTMNNEWQTRGVIMHNNGKLEITGLDLSHPLCRSKEELKEFISWLIIAYKDIFNE